MTDKPWWEDDHFLQLRVGIDIQKDVERELLKPLRSLGIPAKIPAQGGATPMEQVGAVIELVKTNLPYLVAALTVADRIVAWRRKRQAQPHPEPHRTTTVLIVTRPGREPLDTADATDEETITYIMEQRDE